MKIAVFGAGAIGCWVGGMLAAGGADVALIGRPRVTEPLRDGYRVSDLDGGEHRVKVRLVSSVTDEDAVLVTVKSAATADAARALAGVRAPIVSLQNGVRNAAVLHALAGMVPFNVVRPAPAHFHRASAGKVMVETEAAPIFRGMPIEARDDMPAVQWSKLVMNLNNAINALSGVPLAEELSQRAYRRALAMAQREALALIEVPLARVTPIPMRFMPRLLELPDAIFRVLARRVVAIDPTARSSMWEDLEAQRTTEVDYIQGEIVRLGHAPINAKLIELIRAAEAGGKRDYTGDELLTSLRRAG